MSAFYSMGIMNYCSHDPGCALIRIDGSNFDVIFAEEGFLSRKKKSYQFPLRSMKYCLDYFGIDLDRVDVLTLDFMDVQRTFRTSHNYRLLVGDFIRSRLKIDPAKINFATSHHYAHALMAFWPSIFDEAAVLVVDGLGSQQQTHSVFQMSKDGKVELLFEQKGVGIGTLYTLVTRALGFESGEEGKTMGLAPYGRDCGELDTLLPSLEGYFSGFLTDYSGQIFRNPSPSLRFQIAPPAAKDDVYKPYYSRLAFNLQTETEKCLTHLAKEALKATNSKNLCFAGGVALNCVANNHIQHLTGLDKFFVQPAAGDTGIPIGLALAGLETGGLKLSEILTRQNREKLAVPYSIDRGPLLNIYEDRLNAFLDANRVPRKQFDHEEIAKLLSNRNVVALFSEGIELGPRALGHRSFIADARDFEMKDVLNRKVKHREPYRPFAPIVLEEDFDDYFVSNTKTHPYMLQAPRCKKRALEEVPAVCHVDGTARVQTVSEGLGKVRKILESYKRLTGVSVLINTSFNDNDEPIVFTKLDAINAFLNCNADILILEDEVVSRSDIDRIESLKKGITEIQEEFRRSYFRSAIADLTTISTNLSSADLFSFLRFNARLSKAYRWDRMVIKLIDFLTTRDSRKRLYVDDYHYEQIRKLCALMGCSADELASDIHVVNDSFLAGKAITPSSDFILYNFSAFHCSKYVSEKLQTIESLTSFYGLEDKIINIDSGDSNLMALEDDRGCVDEIVETYEHKLSASIESLFSRIGIDRG